MDLNEFSSYFASSTYITQKRYVEKLKLFHLEDPFAIADERWSEDLSKWPDVEFGNVYAYLIDTKGVYTEESLAAYKSLEAYNYYENGHVRTVYHLSTSNHYNVLKAKVNPSQNSPDSHHEAWVVCEDNGTVKTGHCTCMAGLGEVCSHVAVLLFKIDAANRIGFTRPSRTSLPCQWNRNFKTAITPKEIQSIKFVKPKYKRSREEDSESNDQNDDDEIQPLTRIRVESGPQDLPKLSREKLYGSMHKLVPNACLFTIVEPPTTDDLPVPITSGCDASVEQLVQQNDASPGVSNIAVGLPHTTHNCDMISEQPSGVDAPQISEKIGQPEFSSAFLAVGAAIEQPSGPTDVPPVARQLESFDVLAESETNEESPTYEASADTDLPSPVTDYFRSMCIDISRDDVTNTTKQLFYLLNYSTDECQKIEEATRMQRDCTEWLRQREGRLTASSFHTVLNMRKQTDPTVVAGRLLNKQDISHIPAIRWGISNEERARQEYVSAMSSHTDFECTPVGLVVKPLFPHLGASPDGLIICKCCHGSGLIEVKCPYSVRNAHPNTLRGKPQSCLGEVGMSTTHSYYTQVQGQLLVTGKEYCDFVVWTPKGIVIDRVYQDFNFTEKLLRKLTSFYVDFMIPAIIGLTLEQQTEDENNVADDQPELYCFCQQPEYGKMIMCENSACQYVWFHYDCVGIKRACRGLWYCSDCKLK